MAFECMRRRQWERCINLGLLTVTDGRAFWGRISYRIVSRYFVQYRIVSIVFPHDHIVPSLPICVFLWSTKCQDSMWQQHLLLRQGYKAWTLIDRQWASGEPDRQLQLAPEHTAGGLLHQSTCFICRFSWLIPTVNCAVTSDLVQNGVL